MNFRELLTGEVRRNHLLGTSVNNLPLVGLWVARRRCVGTVSMLDISTGGDMPDPDSAGLWLVAAMFLSGISIGFLAAALTLIGVAVFPIRKAGLWTAAGVCFVVAW